jgi:hypothetical protein
VTHDAGVVQQPVQQADSGGVLGQEPAPGLEWPVAGDAEPVPGGAGGRGPGAGCLVVADHGLPVAGVVGLPGVSA